MHASAERSQHSPQQPQDRQVAIMSNLTLCAICEKGDGISGKVSAFKTKYGYRMHLLKVHGLKERDGKLVKVRP